MVIVLLLIITSALPSAWIVAEFKAGPRLRRIFGAITIVWSFGVASLVGGFQNFNANSYFTSATKDLLSVSVEQLKLGHTQAVTREWSRANDQFFVTYENRGKYRQVVDNAIDGMQKP